jgi:Flp pilus assembly protein TadB
MTPSSTLSGLRVEPQPEFAQILREEPYASPGDRAQTTNQLDSSERINRAFDRLLVQSRTRLSGAVVLRLCLLTAIAAGGSAFVLSENLLATAVATGVGAVVPVAALAIRRARRRSRLAEQFATLVEQILRATRAGRRLEPSFDQIAARTASPLGDELRLALRRGQLGLGLADALGELPERTGLSEAQVLVTALRLAERRGEDLAPALETFAESLRNQARQASGQREAAVSDWASGVLVFLLQALVVWLFVMADPQQLARLADSRSSLALAAAAGAILIAGWYCVLRLSANRRSAT